MTAKVVQFQVIDGPHTLDIYALDSEGRLWKRDMLNPDSRWMQVLGGPFPNMATP